MNHGLTRYDTKLKFQVLLGFIWNYLSTIAIERPDGILG